MAADGCRGCGARDWQAGSGLCAECRRAVAAFLAIRRANAQRRAANDLAVGGYLTGAT